MTRTMVAVGRRLSIVLLAALVLSSSAGAQSSSLEKRLATALAVPHVSKARTAAIAYDLQTGETLFSEHDALPLAPASNEKLAVTYAALAALGPEFRIETDVVGRGERDGPVWRGTLLLVGQGDPALSSRGLASLAQQVRAAGITRITGGILGGGSRGVFRQGRQAKAAVIPRIPGAILCDESFFDARRTAPGWKRGFYI